MTGSTEKAVDGSEPDYPDPRRLWRPFDVFCVVVLAVILSAVLWVGLSSGLDYVHIGRSGCEFSHDGFHAMDLHCGTGMSGAGSPSGVVPGG